MITPPANPGHDRERGLLNAALELPPGDRAAFLDHACATDAALRQRLEKLLDAHHEAGAFLEEAALPRLVPALGPTEVQPITEKPGDRIGRYKLLQQIGEGGCGVVYMAEQEEPVRRRVALKVIKLGMDTKQVIARFEAERQALALMDHPNVAKVLDAGATEAGRPFFVMELVRGIKITDYCDQNNLSTRQRLDLFIQVCHAIQHAHQKGIIHRDIKPSNILVSLHDGVPVPVVIDFGIAKATEQKLTDKTLFTAFEQFIGTPAYMSPEQAEMSRLDLDTRSDIYALGVLLYELLTGRTPFDAKTLVAAGLEEMRRIIREEEPPKPSTRLTQELVAAGVSPRTKPSGGLAIPNAKEAAADSRRRLQLREQVQLVRGDLDWIVMKCLEKDRARRYETANGLGLDVERHLRNEPVAACPPSTAYRVQKFVRRNRVMVVSVGAVAFALMAGIVVSSWETVRATRAKREESRQRQTAEKARADEAEQRREATRQRNDAHRQVLRFTVANAVRLQNESSYCAALPWCARAVVLAKNDPVEERMHRTRFASVLLHCPELFQIYTNESIMEHVDFSPDSRRVVTVGMNGIAQVWSIESGTPIGPPLVHSGRDGSPARILHCAFSPDGRRVLTAAASGQARDGGRMPKAEPGGAAHVWDATTGEHLLALPHDRFVTCAAYSPDGRRIVTASFDHTGQLWDASSGQILPPPFRHDGNVTHAAFSVDGRQVLTCGSIDGTVRIWDTTTGQEIARVQAGGVVYTAAFSPDGKWVVAGNYWGKVQRVWEVATGRCVASLPHDEAPGETRCSFSPDGQSVLVATQQDARMWNPWTGQGLFEPVPHYPPFFNFDLYPQFSPDGRWFVTEDTKQSVRVWDAKSGAAVTPSMRHDAAIEHAVFSPDNRYLLTGSLDTSARVWDVQHSQRPQWPAKPGYLWNRVARSFDGKRLAVLCASNRVQVLEASTGKPVTAPLPHPDRISDLKLSPDGLLLATAGLDSTVRIWNATTGAIVAELKHEEPALGVVFDLSGLRLATISGNPQYAGKSQVSITPVRVRIWDTTTGQTLSAWLNHNSMLETIAFSPDNERIVTASRTGVAQIWNVGSGQLAAPPLKHDEAVTDAAFSPDGRLVITSSLDGKAQVWNAATGEPLLVPIQHPFRVLGVAFSSDSRRVFTLTPTGVWGWDLPSTDIPIEDLVALASVAAGVEVDAGGGIQPLTPTQVRSRWMALQARQPRDRLFGERNALQPREISPSDLDVQAFLSRVLLSQSYTSVKAERVFSPVNLADAYNFSLTNKFSGTHGYDHSNVPRGRQRFLDVDFDVNGLVRVYAISTENYFRVFPDEVDGIRVKSKCQRIHFLHSGALHGRYRVHYTNGQSWEIPMTGGPSLGFEVEPAHSLLAWKGKGSQGNDLKLYQTSWENPLPDLEMDSIDFVSSRTNWGEVVLFAITVEL
jgi:eukaryotic-like serine/threonine-protein kinase